VDGQPQRLRQRADGRFRQHSDRPAHHRDRRRRGHGLLAATSIGQIDDTPPGATDYPANGTIFDQLDAHGITWKDYFTTTPDYGHQSEENPQNIAVGEEFAASVVNALINGSAWDRTALLLTYDEHGGYYDHVPPPAAIPPDSIPPIVVPGENSFDGFGRYGFRVPFALVSPWARRNFVSHEVYDHTSILKLVETKWNLPALTYRDANATAMLDMLDLRRPSFATPPELAQPLAVTDPAALSCSVTGPGTIPPPGSVTG
jgi:hypothetical protein